MKHFAKYESEWNWKYCAHRRFFVFFFSKNCESFARIKYHFFAYVLIFPVLFFFFRCSSYCYPKLLIVLIYRRVSKRNPPYTLIYPCKRPHATHSSSPLSFSVHSFNYFEVYAPVCVCVPNLNLKKKKKNIVWLAISNSFWHIRYCSLKYCVYFYESNFVN